MAGRSLNKVMLLGHLGKDPDVRYTNSGRAVATFTLATTQTWRDQDGNNKDHTEWHRVVAWGRLAEICGEYLSKGKQVYIEGRIQSRDWEDQEGVKRSTVEIIANDLIMLGGSGQSQSRDYDSGERKSRPVQQRSSAPKQAEDSHYPPPEDDIPF